MKKSKTERRAHKRRRVIFGAQARAEGKAGKRDCVVRNFSEAGAGVEFQHMAPTSGDVALTIARKGRAYKAKVIWSRDKHAGVAFQSISPALAPEDGIEKQLRKSEREVRLLRSRLKQLTEG